MAKIKSLAALINKEYGLITRSLTGQVKSVADTHLVAYAQKHNMAIFTYESRRQVPRGG